MSITIEASLAAFAHYADMMNEFSCTETWTERDGCCPDEVRDAFWDAWSKAMEETAITITVPADVAEYIEYCREQDREAWDEYENGWRYA